MRTKILVVLAFVLAVGADWAIPADLPMLTTSDISVTNNLGAWGNSGQITFEVKRETCDNARIFLAFGETEESVVPGRELFHRLSAGEGH